MDCETFEMTMVSELYGELDDLTSSAAKRHVAGCARCAARLGALRATRRAAGVPLADYPEHLEERVVAAAERACTAPRPRRALAQLLSLAGGWAMRPQTAMAAVFLVMIGTSLLFLRGKSERLTADATVTVTERGSPATAATSTAGEPWVASGGGTAALGSAAVVGAPRGDDSVTDSFDRAMADYQAGRFGDAVRRFDSVAASRPDAALWAARAAREEQGCAAAVARFDKASRQARATPAGWDALLEAAVCYRQLGDLAAARSRLGGLLGVVSHKDRARAELARIDQLEHAHTSAQPATAKPPAKGAASP